MKTKSFRENQKISIDPELIKKIKSLKLERMEKLNPHKYDLRKFIGIIDSNEKSNGVEEHDLIQ